MTSLLEARNISKSYRHKSGLTGSVSVNVLRDVSFVLEKGQILAVVGESGSGKSTLARQVVKLEKPEAGGLFLDGRSYESIPGIEINQRVRMIFQNPAASLNPRKRVYQLLEEPLLNYTDITAEERGEVIYKILEHVGLNSDQCLYYPHVFSGGQRQRIAIARALILQPDVIVADEAVSALDVSIQAQILNLILDLRDELGMSWLFITHDISVVTAIADSVMVMYAGRVMEIGLVREIVDNPAHPYTRKLLSSVPGTGIYSSTVSNEEIRSSVDFIGPAVNGCVYQQQCPIADADCASSIPAMTNVAGRYVACFKSG